ncbi:inosine-5'-monophosphate dehydrogenase [Cystobasidiomycetes sp. EMM_F5]
MLTYLTASIALLPLLAHAGFANTHALMAFSDKASANLESLRPYSAAASQAHQIKLAASKGEECIDALIVSAPSFGVNDIALLPQDSVIRYEMERAQTSLTLPYVQGRAIENLKDMIGRRFAGRKEWLAGLDRLVQESLDELPTSRRIVVISSVPDLGKHYRQKRQISDEEWDAIASMPVDEESGVAQTSQGSSSSPFAPGYSASKNKSATVDPNAGLLYRYTFTSPALIFSALIVLLVLIPAGLMAINALTSIELLRGLENKMQGGQTGESKKDQ